MSWKTPVQAEEKACNRRTDIFQYDRYFALESIRLEGLAVPEFNLASMIGQNVKSKTQRVFDRKCLSYSVLQTERIPANVPLTFVFNLAVSSVGLV